MKRWLTHIGICAAGVFLFLGIPALCYRGRIAGLSFGAGADAVTGASVAVPEQPSGRFVILMNEALHPDSIGEWETFFREEPVGVIFEDLDCLVIDADAAGEELARRYQARLAENQMRLHLQNGLLAVSKAESGKFDVMIVSEELADAYRLSAGAGTRVLAIAGQ